MLYQYYFHKGNRLKKLEFRFQASHVITGRFSVGLSYLDLGWNRFSPIVLTFWTTVLKGRPINISWSDKPFKWQCEKKNTFDLEPLKRMIIIFFIKCFFLEKMWAIFRTNSMQLSCKPLWWNVYSAQNRPDSKSVTDSAELDVDYIDTAGLGSQLLGTYWPLQWEWKLGKIFAGKVSRM